MNVTALGIFIAILLIFITLLFLALFRIVPVILAIVSGLVKNWKGIRR